MKNSSEICNVAKIDVAGTTLREKLIVPRYTSRYDEEAWEIAVMLPGVKKPDVSVTVENEVLEVNAIRQLDVREAWKPLGDQLPVPSYRLRLDVGPEVDDNLISGSLNNGVLTLRLPLREESKPRCIEIR